MRGVNESGIHRGGGGVRGIQGGGRQTHLFIQDVYVQSNVNLHCETMLYCITELLCSM